MSTRPGPKFLEHTLETKTMLAHDMIKPWEEDNTSRRDERNKLPDTKSDVSNCAVMKIFDRLNAMQARIGV